MKNKFFIMTVACLALFAVIMFSACNDTIKSDKDNAAKSISIVPNPMTIGGTVSISGPNFGSATEIVFPGNVKADRFEKFGDQINVVVPESVSRNGKITVKLSSGDLIIPVDVVIYSTSVESFNTMDVNKEGIFIAGFDDEVYIFGEGLSSISEAIFPGDVSLLATNFRKTDIKLTLAVPFGVPRDIGTLKLVGLNGKVFEIGPIDFSGAPMPDDFIPLLCGEGSKIWTWDLESGFENVPYYLGKTSDAGATTWWNSYGRKTGEGEGAEMVFGWEKRYSGRMILNRTNGTQGVGRFDLDKDHKHTEGKYDANGRILTNKITVLNGIGSDGAVPNDNVTIYDILRLDEEFLWLAWPNNMVAGSYDYEDGCTFWFFRAKKE